MEKYLKYVSIVFFALALGKGLVQSFQLFDVCTLALISGLLGFLEYKNTDARDKVLMNEIKALTDKVKTQELQIQSIVNSVSSLKLVQGKVFGAKS